MRLQIQELGLTSEVVTTPQDSPGARKRYIYYPDRLNRLPADREDYTIFNLWKLWSSGILGGIQNVLAEPLQESRPLSLKDESIGDFVSRRFDKRIADNIVSAVVHGIYAGDIYRLSARALMSQFWAWEGSAHKSVLAGYYATNVRPAMEESARTGKPTRPTALMHPYDSETSNAKMNEIQLEPEMRTVLSPKQTSMFTFRDGMQTLVRKLEENLQQNPNVRILKETRAEVCEKMGDGSKRVEVSTNVHLSSLHAPPTPTKHPPYILFLAQTNNFRATAGPTTSSSAASTPRTTPLPP